MRAYFQSLFADPYGAPALVRRLLLEYALVYWKRYLAAFSLMAVAAACTAMSAYLFGDVVNQAYVFRNMPAIVFLSVAIVAIFMIKGFSSYGHSVILARIANHMIAENQRKMFDRLLTQNLGYFSDRHSTEFIARLSAGASSASEVLSQLVNAMGRDLLSLIGLVTVMIIQDPVMSLVGLVIIPPTLLLLRKLIRRSFAVAYSQFAGGAAILETFQEALQGIRIVKAFTLEDVMRSRIHKDIAAFEAGSVKLARVTNRAGPLMESLAGVAIAISLLYGSYYVIATNAAPGQFVSFMIAFLLAYEPAKRLVRLNILIMSNLVAVQKMFEVIDSPPTEPVEEHKPPLSLSHAQVEFRDVHFAYRPGEPVIKGMSFVAEPGRLTALVGPSGGGKSTVLNMILRFYEPSAGSILIDGQDIATRSRRSLRQQIGYVGQDVFLFRGTVRENIAFGKPNATDEEIVAAAKAAHAHDFIMASAAGYQTQVGEHGLQLSGGERQRIAVARALIRNAAIILLDEATASLDSESERLVQDAIAILCRGRTTLVIAHRLHTIVHADRILVIEDGMIVETGRHEELLRKGGRYASFYRLQLKHQEPREPVAAVSNA